MNMRMAYTEPEEQQTKTFTVPKVEIHGRLKSDITSGFERIYERSYY